MALNENEIFISPNDHIDGRCGRMIGRGHEITAYEAKGDSGAVILLPTSTSKISDFKKRFTKRYDLFNEVLNKIDFFRLPIIYSYGQINSAPAILMEKIEGFSFDAGEQFQSLGCNSSALNALSLNIPLKIRVYSLKAIISFVTALNDRSLIFQDFKMGSFRLVKERSTNWELILLDQDYEPARSSDNSMIYFEQWGINDKTRQEMFISSMIEILIGGLHVTFFKDKGLKENLKRKFEMYFAQDEFSVEGLLSFIDSLNISNESILDKESVKDFLTEIK